MSAQGDCEFLVKRARELVPGDLWAAKAWLITARSLYPADFNIQVTRGRRRHGQGRRAGPPHGLAAGAASTDGRFGQWGRGGGATGCRGDGDPAAPSGPLPPCRGGRRAAPLAGPRPRPRPRPGAFCRLPSPRCAARGTRRARRRRRPASCCGGRRLTTERRAWASLR